MDGFVRIFEIRRVIDPRRQPRLRPDHSALERMLLNEINEPHPYSLTADQLETLRTNPVLQVRKGPIAEPSNRDFVYRLSSVWKLVNFTTGTTATLNKWDTDDNNWLQLKRDYDDKQDWLRMGDYAVGEHWGPDGFTWWTGTELSVTNIVADAHTVGLPNDWIPVNAIVLRCPTRYVEQNRLIRVPSILDGFASVIFRSTRDEDSPKCGITIDLNRSSELVEGVEEFVVDRVDVGGVELIPVYIDSNLRVANDIQLSALLPSLEAYYRKLDETVA